MHEIGLDLLILLAGIWLVAVTLRPLGLPTIMGELIVGLVVGPAVLGLIHPNEAITLLAEIGIFFLMFHSGVETQPSEFFDALKRSLGVAIVGAIVPFSVSFGLATAFGLDPVGAVFVGLTMTATAVVITLKSLKDLGLANTRMARVIVASCVIDDLITLVVFGLVIGVLSGGSFEPMSIAVSLGKLALFFGGAFLLWRFVYPRLTLPFRSQGGKGFTFVLLTAFAAGLLAEAIGLHMILGAYLAGLFFEEKVAHPNLVRIVHDRAYGIAYSFLGPIFFISLGFSITFDISGREIWLLVLLTTGVVVGQIASAGGMALRIGMPAKEAITVGVGMCGRAEMAFILASLALAQGAIDQGIFSVLIFTAFVLNLFTPMALKGCAVMLEGKAARGKDGTRGVLQFDKFEEALIEESRGEQVLTTVPRIDDGIVIYGYGPEVDFLLEELEHREIDTLLIEEDEAIAKRCAQHGHSVVHMSLAEGDIDFATLAKARGVVANGADDRDAMLAIGLRDQGFSGPLVALIENPARRAPMLLAGASAAFTPSHVLAAVLAGRASHQIGPRVFGIDALLDPHVEIAELRVGSGSPLAQKTLAEAAIRQKTGAHIVGQWQGDRLELPPAADERVGEGTLLIAAGTPESIAELGQMARPISDRGELVVVGSGDVAEKLIEILGDAKEAMCVVAAHEGEGVDVVGDILDRAVLERASVAGARAVILALDTDSEMLFATTVVRDHSPDVPIICSVELLDNVARAQDAGADFAVSVSQVAGQILIRQVLGETVSLQSRIKLLKVSAGPLAGRNLHAAGIRERTGCSVVGVERDGDLVMSLDPELELGEQDALYVCGTGEALDHYLDEFEPPRL